MQKKTFKNHQSNNNKNKDKPQKRYKDKAVDQKTSPHKHSSPHISAKKEIKETREQNPPSELPPYIAALKQNKTNKLEMIYGLHAAQAALDNKQRKIKAVIIDPKAQGKTKNLYQQLSQNPSPAFELIEANRSLFEMLTGAEATHQGIVVFAHPLPTKNLEDLYHHSHALIVILDQPSDPRNIGAIIRSCAAFNVTALIIPDHNSPDTTPLIAKTAAGGLEHVPIIRIGNLKKAMDQLKANGFWLIGMDGHTDTHIHKIPSAEKTVLILGSEGSGLRRLTSENCDFLAKIPISGHMESLNMSVAAGISLYEVHKKMHNI